jgi:hypothetical protein
MRIVTLIVFRNDYGPSALPHQLLSTFKWWCDQQLSVLVTGRSCVTLLWSISKSATPSRWCKSKVGLRYHIECCLDSFVPTLLTLFQLWAFLHYSRAAPSALPATQHAHKFSPSTVTILKSYFSSFTRLIGRGPVSARHVGRGVRMFLL